jgi:hypothetical protein
VIIAAQRAVDIPAGVVTAAVVDGTERAASSCQVMEQATYGHAFFQTWPSHRGDDWVLSDQVNTLEWVETDRVIICTHVDSDHCAFKCIAYDGYGYPAEVSVRYRWVALAGTGEGNGSLVQWDYSGVGNRAWHAAQLGEYAGLASRAEGEGTMGGGKGLFDVRGRRIHDRSRLGPGIYFERRSGKTVKKLVVR